LPNLSNWMIKQPLFKELLQHFLGIDKRRSLPEFADQTFMDWWNTHKNASLRKTSDPKKVVLLIDFFTNYHDPEIGKAAVRFLESQGYVIRVPDFHEVGRPQISKGMLTHAKRILDDNLPKLASLADQGVPIIGLEPSEILTLRDEYLDLCDDDRLEQAEMVAEHAFTFEEFAKKTMQENKAPNSSPENNKVYIHGHCHAKALVGNSAIQQIIEEAGFKPIVLDTGCCGMAGSFGYEQDHYDVSMDIGEQRLFPALRNLPDDAIICAPGFSCRHQITHGVDRKAFHPAEILAKAR